MLQQSRHHIDCLRCSVLDPNELTHRQIEIFVLQQRADRRLNAQLLDSELDDTLESFEGGCNLGCSAIASVRYSATKQATGMAREKDKADRATYQTVLDPRTRLVRHALTSPLISAQQMYSLPMVDDTGAQHLLLL